MDPKDSMNIGIYKIPSAKELIGHKTWADEDDIKKYQRWIDHAMTPGTSKGYRKYIEFCVKRGHLTTSSSSIFGDWIDKEKPRIKEVEDALQDLWPNTDESTKERLKDYAETKLKESVNFERGIEPIDAMELGDVQGRKMKIAYKQLRKAIEEMAVEWWGPDILEYEDNPYMRIKELNQKLFIEIGIERTDGATTYFYYLAYVPEPDPDNGGANWAAGYEISRLFPNSQTDEIPYDSLEDAINKMKYWYKKL
jgi:hypothetical protein